MPVQAQEALVLSGGAARGLAHGGVLVGLERRGHDPEIVVGASMGAVIGALYAAGCDAEAVQAIVREQRWRDLFTPLPVVLGPARELRDPILRLQSGRGSGLAARGYLSDWRVNRELVRRLFDPAARAGGDFDRLPRRFRAVATDLATGELVVLTHGDLARAVRASLATPGFFPPVRWQGRYLVDGVLRDYLPVGIAREMGAGTVIASDVIHPNVADTPKADAGYAAERSINWLSVHADRDTSMADGLILPRIDRAPSALVFPTDPSELLQAGLDAALAAPLPEPARRTSKPVRAVPSALTGLQLVDVDPAVSGLLDRSLRGSAYDEARVLRAVDRLYATGLFEGVWPSVEDSSGSSVLYARADVRGRLALLGALGYDNDRGGRAWGTLRRLSSLGSSPLDFALEGSVDGIEKEVSVSARLPGAGRGSPAWSVGGNVSEQTIRSVPELVEEPDVQRAGGWLALDLRQIEPSLYAALAFRAEHVAADAGPDGDSFGPLLRAGEVLGFERPVGLASALELEARFGELDYRRARLRASHAFANRRAAVAPLVCFESVSREAPWDRVPALGDEHLVPGLGWGDRRGRLVTLLGLDASHVVPLWTTLVLRTRAGRVTEGEDWGTVGDEWVGGVAISAYWWLPFGRVELGGSGATTGDRRVDVRLGTEF